MFGSAPTPQLPKEEPAPPTREDPDVEAARRDELRRSREAGRRGREATILTGRLVANPGNDNATPPGLRRILGG